VDFNKCVRCAKEMGNLAVYCNGCGHKLPPPPRPPNPQERADREREYIEDFGEKCGEMHHALLEALCSGFCPECGRRIGPIVSESPFN